MRQVPQREKTDSHTNTDHRLRADIFTHTSAADIENNNADRGSESSQKPVLVLILF